MAEEMCSGLLKHQANAIRPQTVYINVVQTLMYNSSGPLAYVYGSHFKQHAFLSKELYIILGRPTTSVEIFTQNSSLGNFQIY